MGKKSKKKKVPVKSNTEAAARALPQPPTSDDTGTRTKFKKGDRVSLRGLKAVHHNGKSGSVVVIPVSPGERYGVLVDGAKKPIAIQPKNILLGSGRRSTQQQREERDKMQSLIERSEDEIMNAEQMAMMRMMMNMFLTEENQIKAYGRKIVPMPNFHAEVMNHGGAIPFGVDHEWANKYLHLVFEQASGLPHMLELAFKQKEFEPGPPDYLKRLGTNDRSKVEWYFQGQAPGTIYREHCQNPYPDFVRHSFSNQPYRKEALCGSTTHVAAGFVDLGMLFASELHDAPKNYTGPLRFVGVELSAYAVAKTHVIWEMMKQTPSTPNERRDHVRSVMQVWFSATWGDGTEVAVKSALVALTSSERSYHQSVREILSYWADAPTFSLSKARNEIKKATTNAFSSIGDLLKKPDRIAMARYELSRDFGVIGTPVCGNTLMFDCPDGTPPLGNDESVFSAFSWNEIVGLMRSNHSNMTVIEAAEAYALANIEKVASWATSGEVDVELICAGIHDMIDDIASRKPWTMSWSNICDYCDYTEFHRMARACSKLGDTIHFGYSMNWVLNVYGTNIIDFCGERFVELRASLLESSNKAAETCYRQLGWDHYLRLPPPTNPINTVSHFGLEQLHYQKWCAYFFELARRQGPCQAANVEHAFTACSPLSATGTSTVTFTWTYDPDIKFNNLAL